MPVPTATAPHTLDDKEREQIKKLVEAEGLAGAARTLNVSRGVVSSAAAGIEVRRGSLELVRDALRKQPKGSKK